MVSEDAGKCLWAGCDNARLPDSYRCAVHTPGPLAEDAS